VRALLLGLLTVLPAAAWAQPAVKLGVITDISGSLSAQSGQGSVVAAELAVEDCLKRECKGMHIDVLSADHQNKPDVAVGIVRKWIDVDGVNAVTDIIQAAVQLAAERHGGEGPDRAVPRRHRTADQ
jgi:branched-chain amino acid transport system substrate-binding protein